MSRESCPVSDSRAAFFLYDPLGKGKNPGLCLAWEMAWKRRIHEELDWLHLQVDSVQQIERGKE